MAKRDTYGYRAERERAKAETRIRGIEGVLRNENLTAPGRERFERKISELREAQFATRQRTREGRIIEGRTRLTLSAALEKLKGLNRMLDQFIGSARRANKITQSEINAASEGLESSQYTEAEVKVFYRATQKAWNRPDVDISQRNEAILEYYGYSRLSVIMDEVLQQNIAALRAAKLNPFKGMTQEQQEEYETALQSQGSDTEKGSPTYMAAVKIFESGDAFITEFKA